MNIIALSVVLVPVAAASSALAGPYDQPYALVESGRRSAVRKELPVFINAIDGKSTLRHRHSAAVSPGKHKIDVFLPIRTGPSERQNRVVEIDAATCMRYRIVAHYENLTHLAWHPVVYAEPVGECKEKFTRQATYSGN